MEKSDFFSLIYNKTMKTNNTNTTTYPQGTTVNPQQQGYLSERMCILKN